MPNLIKNSHSELKNYQLQSLILCFCMLLIYALVAWLMGGLLLMTETFLILGALLILAPYLSPNIVLRIQKAKKISPTQATVIYQLVKQLSERANISIHPQIYYTDSNQFTAFTVGGHKKSVVVLSDGLLRRLNRRELNAVLAHEIAHIKNQDIRILAVVEMMNMMLITTAILMFVSLVASLPLAFFSHVNIPLIPFLILAIAAVFVFHLRMKLSHAREFEADRTAALLTEDPEALISALEKLTFHGWKWLDNLFFIQSDKPISRHLRTHPENKDRIRNLKIIAESIQKQHSIFEISPLEMLLPKHLREIQVFLKSNN